MFYVDISVKYYKKLKRLFIKKIERKRENNMGTYTGCIIEESLKDKTILDEFNILETREDDGISYIV